MLCRLLCVMSLLFGVSMAHAEQASHGGHVRAVVPPDCMVKKGDDPEQVAAVRCSPVVNASFDHHGRLWLVWVNDQHVYVNYSDDKGRSYSRPVRVNQEAESIAAQGENRPKIALDQQGRIYLTWTQKLPQRFSGHIRFSRSLDGGKHFSRPVTVNDHLTVTSHRFESLAVNDRGDIFIAWLDKRDKLAAEQRGEGYTGAALYYAVSRDHGQTFNANVKVADHSCECCRTALAIDHDQLPVILWRHIFDNHTRDHALVKLRDVARPGEVVRVSHDHWQVEACPHHGPDLSIAADGSYHAVWFNNAVQRHGLFYAHSNDQGQKYSVPVSFGNYALQASHPQVLAVGQGVYLAWQEFDGKAYSLRVMLSRNGVGLWSVPIQVALSSNRVDYPKLLADHDTVYVAWHEPGQPYRLIPLTFGMK